MRYAHFDHAGWLQKEIAAAKRCKPSRREAEERVGLRFAPDELNDFQCRAVTMMGIAFGGIYNVAASWMTSRWGDDFVVVNVGTHELSTTDTDNLTVLVFLAHVAKVRVAIQPLSPHLLRLTFHRRGFRGGISQRHPGLTEAVEWFEAALGENHPIRLKPEEETT